MELSLNEILLIVGSFEARELRTVLMWVCLIALAAIVGGSLVSYAVRKLDAVRKRDKVAAVGFVAATLMFMLYAGVSNDWDFRFMVETGVYDAGSWIDEETGEVHAFWDYEQWAAGYKLKWFYTYKYRDEEFGPFPMPDADVSACHAEYTLPTAGENWEPVIITCYTEYVPPIHVVTNGVYHLSGVMRSIDSTNAPLPKYVTPGITIKANLSDGSSVDLAPVDDVPDVPSVLLSSPQNENEGE